jgi:DNA-binding IclR family transcriptional regulator
MEQLVKQCHETALVAVLRRGGVVPVDTVEANQPVRLASLLGESLPLHCTAAGKAYLAFESEDDLKESLSETLERYTPETITDRQVLGEHLKVIAAAGYAVDNGEFVADLRSVAAPIRDYTRQLVGSLAISGPAYRFPPERIEKEVVPLVVKAGKELSSRLGYNEE